MSERAKDQVNLMRLSQAYDSVMRVAAQLKSERDDARRERDELKLLFLGFQPLLEKAKRMADLKGGESVDLRLMYAETVETDRIARETAECQLTAANRALVWALENLDRAGEDVPEEVIQQVAIAGAARAAGGEKT